MLDAPTDPPASPPIDPPPAGPATADLLRFALELADLADAYTLPRFRAGLTPERKGDGTLVTEADRGAEALLRERIARRDPRDAVLGEEAGETPGVPGASGGDGGGAGGVRWLLDPVDGTHNFVRGIPVWATLIACAVGGEVVVGVASAPALDTRWWAGRGLGAYRGGCARGGAGERIHVTDTATVEAAQVLFGGFDYIADRWGDAATHLLRGAWRSRGLGDFWQHCLVAEGAAEVALEGAANAWDLAALLPIVEEAGGRMTDSTGAARLDAGYCITTNGALHGAVLGLLGAGRAAPGA